MGCGEWSVLVIVGLLVLGFVNDQPKVAGILAAILVGYAAVVAGLGGLLHLLWPRRPFGEWAAIVAVLVVMTPLVLFIVGGLIWMVYIMAHPTYYP
jgi:hypothetical protein